MLPAFIANIENNKRKGLHEQEQRVGASVHMYSDDDFDDLEEDDEGVWQSKGGSAPRVPSPQEEAAAQIEIENARAERERQAAAAAAEKAAAERAQLLQKAQQAQAGAWNSATQYGRSQLDQLGIDDALAQKYGIYDQYQQRLNNTRGTIAEDNTNPLAAYNMEGTWSDVLSGATNRFRNDNKNALTSKYGDNFAQDTFQDTADDEFLQQILDRQRGEALTQIDAAKARGQLNDVGYAKALQGLDTSASAGMADLQDLGGGVLAGYRKDLLGLRDNALTTIGNSGFDNPFNLGGFESQIGGKVNDYRSRLVNDINRATQGKSFFDPSKIIGGAGALQGFYNPSQSGTGATPAGGVAGGANPLLEVFSTAEQQKKPQLGNGVF